MRGKKHKSFFVPKAAFSLILILAALYAGYRMSGANFKNIFFSSSRISQSESILTGIRGIFTVSTVEYVYKTVFPFDFYDKDTNFTSLLLKRERSSPLTEKESDALKLYDLCRKTGIPLGNGKFDFVVITSVIKAGLGSPGDMSAENIEINGRNITVVLPKTEITEFIIEDTSSREYSYPDIAIDPEHWKLITDYVKPRVMKKVLEKGILNEAEERLKEFISSLLSERGFDKIDFK